MKISQLVATKKYTQYYESVANKLPRGIKTQQQLLNLGYRVAVEDLGLAKAKTLDENFAAKLVNSYHKQCIDEGIGSFLGKAAGNVVGAVNAAGRGIKNAWNDAKAGYAAGKSSWDDNAAATPAAGGTAVPAAGGTAAAPAAAAAPAGGGSDRPYVAPAGGGIGDIMKAIDGLDPASKKQLAGELEKSINTPAPAEEEPAAAPKAPAEEEPAGTPEPQGQALDLDQLKKDREAKLAAGQAGQQQAQQQMAATAQANAATNQQDAAIKTASDAAKAKSGFQRTAADNLAIKAATAKGISEEDEIAEGFHSKFLGMII